MGTITTRVFSRTAELGNLPAAMVAVIAEVNDFLSTLDFNDVADVRYTTSAVGKYGEYTLYQGVVLYLE